MASLGTTANILGVITPAKDVVDIIKAINDSFEKAKRNKIKTSELIKTLYSQIGWVDSAILQFKHASQEQLKSLTDLKLSLKFILAELQEIDENSRQRSSSFFNASKDFWNSGDILTRIQQLEFDLKRCHELFLADSLTRIEHTGDTTKVAVMSIYTQLANNGGGMTQSSQEGRLSRTWKRSAILWKTPMKMTFNDLKILDYSYLSSKVHDLMNAVKSSGGWIEQLFQNNVKNFSINPIAHGQFPIGDPTIECEDASQLAIHLSRPILERNSKISVIKWFEKFRGLGFTLYEVGLNKEAQEIWKFEYHMLVLLASEENNNLDRYLARCLYNMASSYFKGEVEALPLLEKSIEIYRRLDEPFIPELANSLRMLSRFFCYLGHHKKAAESLQESLDLFHELASNDPMQYGWQMAQCLSDKVFLHHELRDYQKAIDCCEEANRWLLQSSALFKKDVPYYYADIQWFAALAYKELGDLEKAIGYGKEATRVVNSLIHGRPLFYLAISTSISLSHWFQRSGCPHDAIYIIDDSLTIYCSIVPFIAVQHEFANTLYRRAEILHSNGQFGDALDALSHVIDVRHHLMEEFETDTNYLLCLLSAFTLRCSCLISLHRRTEAINAMESILDILRSSLMTIELRENHIDSLLKELISHESMLKRFDCAESINDLKEFKKALNYIDEVIIVLRQRTLNVSGDHSHLNLACLLTLRYRILFRMSKFDIALLSIQEVINLHCHIVDQNGNIESRMNLIRALSSYGHCLSSMQRAKEALASSDEIFEHIGLIKTQEQSALLIDEIIDLLDFHDTAAEMLMKEKAHSKALDTMNRSISAVRSLNVGITSRATMLLGRMLIMRSICYFELKCFEEAVGDANESIEIHRSLMTEDIDERYLVKSLYEHAKSLFAIRNINGALNSIKEAIDIGSRIQQRDPDEIRNDFTKIVTLHIKLLSTSISTTTDGNDELNDILV